jgi:hypothetical protein
LSTTRRGFVPFAEPPAAPRFADVFKRRSIPAISLT